MSDEDRSRKVFRNAATGALLGLGIGALTGNAGRGAGIGALTGAATGLFGGEKEIKGGSSKSKSRKRRKRASKKTKRSKTRK
jgi:hypothetical protein